MCEKVQSRESLRNYARFIIPNKTETFLTAKLLIALCKTIIVKTREIALFEGKNEKRSYPNAISD